ncbi:MAG TPA: Mth938-like domain-containing protein [Rhodocyclaceae bacterium]|nr:Mth938-like domain-containing protein [Rhodocyclaceae bacterium]
MKLQREDSTDLNLITSYDALHIAINRDRRERSLIVTPERIVDNWATAGFSGLSEADIAQLRELSPALVLIGSGQRQHFPTPVLLRPLIEAGIGFEIMDTGSACRTYNILASEGRRVAAVLLLDTVSGPNSQT